jgi:hypothetical protein
VVRLIASIEWVRNEFPHYSPNPQNGDLGKYRGSETTDPQNIQLIPITTAQLNNYISVKYMFTLLDKEGCTVTNKLYLQILQFFQHTKKSTKAS